MPPRCSAGAGGSGALYAVSISVHAVRRSGSARPAGRDERTDMAQYLVLIYEDEAAWATPEVARAGREGPQAFAESPAPRSSAATRCSPPPPRRRSADAAGRRHRRAVRRDQGGARRLLPDRGRATWTQAIALAKQVPGAVRRRRGPPGHGLRLSPGGGAADPVAVAAAVADAHRREWAFVLAATVRVTRDLDLAEECVQDAYAAALTAWRARGVPAQPGAWLTTAARAPRARPAAARGDAARASCRCSSTTTPRRRAGATDGRHPRRPAAADLHLLPPGARRARRRSR